MLPRHHGGSGSLAGFTAPSPKAQLCLNPASLQGVSTTLYAATAPELKGQGGAYLSDCTVTQPSKICQDMETVSSGPHLGLHSSLHSGLHPPVHAPAERQTALAHP